MLIKEAWGRERQPRCCQRQLILSQRSALNYFLLLCYFFLVFPKRIYYNSKKKYQSRVNMNKREVKTMEIFSGLLQTVPKEIAVIGVAAMPVLELRASIPLGIAFSMDWRIVYILSILGNLLPVPFIIKYMRPVFSFLRKTKYFEKLIHWLEKRTMKKAETVMKYSALGLFLVVAIPLPGTGAWTGSMVAALLDMRMKYAMSAISLGVVAAGVVVTCICFGVF